MSRVGTQLPNSTSGALIGGTLQRKCACGDHGDGSCGGCGNKRESLLQRAAINSDRSMGENGVPPVVHQVLGSAGQLLDASTRAFMEPRLGHDFSGVRVHTGARADESARAVNAAAYTVGQLGHILINLGPHTRTGLMSPRPASPAWRIDEISNPHCTRLYNNA